MMYDVLCIMYYVLCIMYGVLCIMYYVLCIMYGVLCIMYYVLCIMYGVLCIMHYVWLTTNINEQWLLLKEIRKAKISEKINDLGQF